MVPSVNPPRLHGYCRSPMAVLTRLPALSEGHSSRRLSACVTVAPASVTASRRSAAAAVLVAAVRTRPGLAFATSASITVQLSNRADVCLRWALPGGRDLWRSRLSRLGRGTRRRVDIRTAAGAILLPLACSRAVMASNGSPWGTRPPGSPRTRRSTSQVWQ
jgi:hypothetical protein